MYMSPNFRVLNSKGLVGWAVEDKKFEQNFCICEYFRIYELSRARSDCMENNR